LSVQRILFIRGGAVGDFVLTTPVLWALREQYARAQIEVLGRREIAILAARKGPADTVSRVDAGDLAPLFSRHGEMAAERQVYFRSFHLIVCIWPDREGVIRERLEATGAQRIVMIDPLPARNGDVHAIDHVLEQARRGGLVPKSDRPFVSLHERDRWWAETYLRVSGAGYGPLLALHAGSGSARKNWPADCFADVCRDWFERGREGGVVLTQGPADERAVETLAMRLPEDRCWVLRNTPLPRLAAVLDRCKAYVGNDSGITHLAAAISIPTVAVFGSTDSRLWAPRGRRAVTVQGKGEGEFPASCEVIAALNSLLI